MNLLDGYEFTYNYQKCKLVKRYSYLELYLGGWYRSFTGYEALGNNTGKLIKDTSELFFAPFTTYAYPGACIMRPWKLQPKDFVISNNPDAYPSDGRKQGYYYQLFGQATATQTLSLAPRLFNDVKDLSIREVRMEVKNNADTETTGTGGPA